MKNFLLLNLFKKLREIVINQLSRIKWTQIFGVSKKRRLEFFAVVFCINLWLHTQTLCIIVPIYLFFKLGIYWKIFITFYIIHIIFDKGGRMGSWGQGIGWFRSLTVWKLWAEYFPMKIIKTCEIPPNKNYLFAFSPHGIWCFHIFTHFGTNATGFHALFPGIKCNLATILLNFMHPFYRELVLAWGVVSCSYESIKHILSQSPTDIKRITDNKFSSNAIGLAIGGATEGLMTQKGQYKIYIKNRKGFVRVAIETGASIVPVFTFGENDIYDILDIPFASAIRRFQNFFKKITGFTPIFFTGRGIFQHNFGLLPRRVPIYTVFGSPIDIMKNEAPTKEDIDMVHGEYMEAVVKLFEEHKWNYVKDAENVKLIMV